MISKAAAERLAEAERAANILRHPERDRVFFERRPVQTYEIIGNMGIEPLEYERRMRVARGGPDFVFRSVRSMDGMIAG